ncbi:hypothetical protein [Citrobacter braakii]|uniref:hypothetical protein n=1 Tax=Citrobacter braakii TaxID=57706 RepID=UPI0040392118
MFKKLFRRLAGGQTRPKILFTCRGITSELVATVNIRSDSFMLVMLLNMPGAEIDFVGWRIWRISSVAHTQELSRIHNRLLGRK